MPLQQISVSTVDRNKEISSRCQSENWKIPVTVDRNKEISSRCQSENWKIPEPVFTTSGLGDPKMERCPSQSSTLSNNNDICRICHCEGDSEAPLIAPCYCAGSLRYVHQACLQQWIKSSDIRCCELCKFTFIMQSKLKPVNQWESLGMSAVERRKLLCSVVFHAVALACVVWSLYILIDRTAEEMQRGALEWPFWTKLVVVAIGLTGGVVFMYIQCKVYLHLCRRWRAFNRVIYVQDAPEKVPLAAPAPAAESFVAQTCCGIERRNEAAPPPAPAPFCPRPAEAKAFFVDETRPPRADAEVCASVGGSFERDDPAAAADSEERSRLLGSCSAPRNAIAPAHDPPPQAKRHSSAPGGRLAAGADDARPKARSLGSQSPLLVQRFGGEGAEK